MLSPLGRTVSNPLARGVFQCFQGSSSHQISFYAAFLALRIGALLAEADAPLETLSGPVRVKLRQTDLANRMPLDKGKG